jgi:hypothetical protein
MSFFCRLSGKHYWCTPHRSADRRLVQVCYECGAERPAHEFHDDFAAERLNQSIMSAKAEVVKLASTLRNGQPSAPSSSQERIAVGQGSSHKFLLVK